MAQTDTPLCVFVAEVELLQSANFCSKKWLAVPTTAKWGSTLSHSYWCQLQYWNHQACLPDVKRWDLLVLRMWILSLTLFVIFTDRTVGSAASGLVTFALDLLFCQWCSSVGFIGPWPPCIGWRAKHSPLTENSGLPIAGWEEGWPPSLLAPSSSRSCSQVTTTGAVSAVMQVFYCSRGGEEPTPEDGREVMNKRKISSKQVTKIKGIKQNKVKVILRHLIMMAPASLPVEVSWAPPTCNTLAIPQEHPWRAENMTGEMRSHCWN